MSEAVSYLEPIINLISPTVANLISGKVAKRSKKAKLSKAVYAILRAINHTENFIATSGSTYKPSLTLSDKWLDVAEAIQPLNHELAGMLSRKADFWANPGRWFDTGAEEAIICLKELREKCEALKNQLN